MIEVVIGALSILAFGALSILASIAIVGSGPRDDMFAALEYDYWLHVDVEEAAENILRNDGTKMELLGASVWRVKA